MAGSEALSGWTDQLKSTRLVPALIHERTHAVQKLMSAKARSGYIVLWDL